MNDIAHASMAGVGRDLDIRQYLSAAPFTNLKDGVRGIAEDHSTVFLSGKSNGIEHIRGGISMKNTAPANGHNLVNDFFTLNGDYQKTRREITELLYIEEDEDFTRPTSFALDLALDLLENANAKLVNQGHLFPRGASSTSENGGIYIFWRKKEASIQLEVPPREGGLYYIHVINRGNSSMNRNVSPETLADTLTEFNLW